MPPEPEQQVLALGGLADYPLGASTYMEGPLLLAGIPDGATVEVLDGPPWEASTRRLYSLTSAALPAGGLWIGQGAFVVGPTETTIRARLPEPYTLDVSQPRTAPDHPRNVIVRMLERCGAEIVYEADLVSKRGGFAARVRVPFDSLHKVIDYLTQLGMKVEHVGGHGHLAQLVEDRS